MTPMLKLIAKFAAAGAAIPSVLYGISLAVPLFPGWLLLTVLVLCPPYVMFMATAACGPFDACSISTLVIVMALNAVLYAFIGCCLYVIISHLRRRLARSATRGAA